MKTMSKEILKQNEGKDNEDSAECAKALSNTFTKVVRAVAERQITNSNIAKVEGCASLLLEPDVIEFIFRTASTKDKAEEAKNSVSKRIEYLMQTLRNIKIKGEKNLSVHHLLSKNNEQFTMTAEIHIKCDSIEKYEDTSNVIVEKLENSVKITEPCFSHSSKSIQEGRERALKMAISNARRKVMEIASSSCQLAGRALVVEEKKSTVSKVKLPSPNFRESLSMQSVVQAVEIHSSVEVIYELVSSCKLENTLHI